MSSPAVARLLQIQQELTELQTLSKPTPDALQRLQVLANELQALQAGPAPCAPPPPPPCAPAPPPPVPPVFVGSTFFPMYGAEPRGCGLPCGGCGECEQCYNPCAPAACGNPLPLSVFQGPNGCAPAYTIQGPPGLVGPPGPTASTYIITQDNSGVSTDVSVPNFTYTGTVYTIVAFLPQQASILNVAYIQSSDSIGPQYFGGNDEGISDTHTMFFVYSYNASNGRMKIIIPQYNINHVDTNNQIIVNSHFGTGPPYTYAFKVYYSI